MHRLACAVSSAHVDHQRMLVQCLVVLLFIHIASHCCHDKSLPGRQSSGCLTQGALQALLGFMYQLEHLAVLFALLNVKGSGPTGPQWRKRRYAKVIQLLDTVRTDKHFAEDIDAVTLDMWDSRICSEFVASAKRLSGSELGKSQPADVETACERLRLMDLYVDTVADAKIEEAGNNGSEVVVDDEEADNSDQDEEEADDTADTQEDGKQDNTG